MALVLVESISPEIIKIVLNDPGNLNAMGESMAEEFVSVVAQLRSQAEKIRAVIITGSGRAFSAGGNLEMLEKKRELAGETNRLRMLRFYDSFLSILSLKVPLIAAINGHAIGAGLCLACACDVRVAAETAKLGMTFTKLGLHPGMGGTYFIPRIIGSAAAGELILTGRIIEAPEALRLGLVSKLYPATSVVDEAVAIAQEICGCGPEAVRQVLETLRGERGSLPESLQREALCQSVNYGSAEFAEGVRATIEKRPARFNTKD